MSTFAPFHSKKHRVALYEKEHSLYRSRMLNVTVTIFGSVTAASERCLRDPDAVKIKLENVALTGDAGPKIRVAQRTLTGAYNKAGIYIN